MALGISANALDISTDSLKLKDKVNEDVATQWAAALALTIVFLMSEQNAIQWPQKAFSPDMKERIANAKVLAVGAGGIGCELLKTLVLSGFKNIETIDLDTIEVSNLNRQFLFRKHHVGQSKASVAAAAVKRFRPDVSITSHQANVKESKYDIDFFKQFDLVLNGLDNLDARRHVNRMCLAAKVPLVESGTAGYLGQVSVHVGGQTECFDCQAKPVPKTYAVCTIRTSPDKPIHCVVWAKDLLFPLLFGPSDGENDLDPDGALIRGAEESAVDFAGNVFNHVFETKIREVLETAEKDVWEGRSPPKPISLEALKQDINAAAGGKNGTQNSSSGSACAALGLTNQNEVWTAAQSAAVFIEAARQIFEHRSSEVGSLTFDKDDHLAVEFVSAAANLRSMCYHIPPQSLFDTKGMAGNIIHAIATTNAIISGLIVVEAVKLLASGGDASTCRASFLRQDLSNRRFIIPTLLEPPNPGCAVCGTARLQVRVDTTQTTLEEFLKKVLRNHLGMIEPCFSYTTPTDGVSWLYEEGEGLEADEVEEMAAYLPKLLAELPAGGMVNNTVLDIQDQRQHLKLQVVIAHQDKWDEEVYPHKFIVEGDVPVAAAAEETGTEDGGAATAVVEGGVGSKNGPLSLENADGTFDILEIEDEGPAVKLAAGKRKHAAEENGVHSEDEAGEAKRAKVAAAAANRDDDDDVIILD